MFFFTVDREAIYLYPMKNVLDQGHLATHQRVNIEKGPKNIDLEAVQLVGIIKRVIKGKATQDQEVVRLVPNLENGMYCLKFQN